MKAVYLISIMTTFYCINIFSQWNKQTSPITSGTFRDVKFIDSNIGWVVGEHHVLNTTNGGETWVEQNAFMNIVNSVFPASSSTIYVVGGSGNIRKTIDGGANWTAQTSGTTSELYSVHFVSENVGWAVGSNGTIIKTTNGGANWNSQTSNVTNTLKVVFFINENYGWAGGGTHFLRTTDGGSTWTNITQFAEVRDIQFLDVNNGYVVETFGASNRTCKTTDGGLTWQVNNTITTGPFYRHSIYFTNLNTGYAAGYSFSLAGSNGIYKTTNGGATWIGQTLNPDLMGRNFYSIYFIDSNTGWAVGEDASIYKTTNGGVTSVDDNLSNPNSFHLNQNYPNPFNPSTKISWHSPVGSHTTLKIYDVLGNEVATLVDEYKEAGNYEIEFNVGQAISLSSGVYFYKLQAGEFIQTKKMALAK